jgi:hypothetical protein
MATLLEFIGGSDEMVQLGRKLGCVAVHLLLCSAMGSACLAVDDPVQAGHEALRTTRQPWYDADADALTPIDLETNDTELQRGQWQPENNLPRWNWGSGWSLIGELLKMLVWGFLFVLIGYLIYLLAQTYLNLAPVKTSVDQRGMAEDDLLTDEQRIENLPVMMQTTKGDFLAAARQCYQQGDFSAAIVYLFSHRLLQLDKAGCLRLMKGKTNRQYLLEVQGGREMQMLLGQTMSAFEDVFFGKYALDRARFEQCWNRNDQFQVLINQVTE